MSRSIACLVVLAAVVAASAAQNVVAKFDSRMAVSAVVDTNGVKWIDGECLPIEGRAFDDVEHYYDRLPANVTTNVNAGVRAMKHHTSGLMFRFSTDSAFICFKWVPYCACLEMDNMPASGVSGIDVYRFDAKRGKWRYVKTGRITKPSGGSLKIPWTPGDPCLVHLPLYNGIRSFALGIDKDASVSALPSRQSGVTKPVVFYGTSITHGGCASRPGLSFVNIIGRELDVPVVNLGFSGSGFMEYEMSEHIARIDASCYVLDCLANMGAGQVKRNYERFIRNLRKKRPDVPIVMAGQGDVYGVLRCPTENGMVKALYEKLVKEGWKGLFYLPPDGMFGDSGDSTVDATHPNDRGMAELAVSYGTVVRKALGL